MHAAILFAYVTFSQIIKGAEVNTEARVLSPKNTISNEDHLRYLRTLGFPEGFQSGKEEIFFSIQAIESDDYDIYKTYDDDTEYSQWNDFHQQGYNSGFDEGYNMGYTKGYIAGIMSCEE